MKTALSHIKRLLQGVAGSSEFDRPRLGLVLGSGLGGLIEGVEAHLRLPYAQIPEFPRPLTAGHRGELVLGQLRGTPIACLSGRVHLYEGRTASEVVAGTHLLAELGCEAVVLTNAAGSLHPGLPPGSIVLITDHLNLTGHNPLMSVDRAGQPARFVDMTNAYDAELRQHCHQAAKALKLELSQGVYAGVLGPSYETPAEVRMLRAWGADTVGMSTVLETIALREREVKVGALSFITNFAAGVSSRRPGRTRARGDTETLGHDEVLKVARSVEDRGSQLIAKWLELIHLARPRGGAA